MRKFRLRENYVIDSENLPTDRILYINKDLSNYYSEGEFHFDNWENFIIKNDLDNFGILLKKTRTSLATIFISIG